jgi:xanthine/uracil/vitamin C permease (AzgA family)
MVKLRRNIESIFKLKDLNTNIRTEVLAGLTTFPIVKFFSGRHKEVSQLSYVLAIILVFYFVFLRVKSG